MTKESTTFNRSARRFLRALYRKKRAGDYVLIWVKDKAQGGSSYWFKELDEAAKFAETQAARFDVYFGIAMSMAAGGKFNRIKENNVAAIPGLWVEVDHKSGAAHKKENLPPTPEEALGLINSMSFKPSLIVSSGNGFHAYWLFKDLLRLYGVEGRRAAKALVERWQRLFKRLAAERGWDVDSTFDLARLYRVPGTINHKDAKDLKGVRTVEQNRNRYNPEEIRAYLDRLPEPVKADHAEQQAVIQKRVANASPLALDPKAEPPEAKLEMLLEVEPNFRQTWEHQRQSGDLSPSGYDLSLASYAYRAGWQDQEVTNLIIAFRRRHGHDLKLRHDYYSMTLAKAKSSTLKGDGRDETAYANSAGGKESTTPFPELDRKALHGLAGEIVHTISPHTEAHPAALLVQILVAFGNAIGRTAYFTVESTKHYLTLFAVLVGLSSKGRKGTSWDHVLRLFQAVDETWARDCVQSGLSSGEGLIWAVRDPVEKQEPIREKGRIVDYQMAVVDPGVEDKRLLTMEPEFAIVLRVIVREGNTLSSIIRRAWDNGNLRSMTKNSPARATGAHISIVGHITKDELRRNLDEVEIANGFANRFLWVSVKRMRLLPEGGNLPANSLISLISSVRAAVEHAISVGEMRRDSEASTLWAKMYEELSAEDRTGLFDAVTSRAEAQVMRLACVYALLDQSSDIRRVHLEAAYALWRYCEDSARFIFGDATGDRVADMILSVLREAGESGLTRTDISNLLGRNASAGRIGQALASLSSTGLARSEKQNSDGGRPAERWFAVCKAEPSYEVDEINEKSLQNSA